MSVLLLHGWPGDAADWRAVAALLDGVAVAAPEKVRALAPPGVTPLPDAGHFSPLEAPGEWAQAIRAAL